MTLTGEAAVPNFQTPLYTAFKANLHKEAKCLDKNILTQNMDKKHKKYQGE